MSKVDPKAWPSNTHAGRAFPKRRRPGLLAVSGRQRPPAPGLALFLAQNSLSSANRLPCFSSCEESFQGALQTVIVSI